MDTDFNDIWHSSFPYDWDGNNHYNEEQTHLQWDRLHLPHTCRQIFADAASKYFEIKILPLSTRIAAFDDTNESPEWIAGHLSLLQIEHVRHIILSRTQLLGTNWNSTFEPLYICET